MNECKACQHNLAYGTEKCSFCGTSQLPDKWVETSPNVFKLVSGDDPRPAVKMTTTNKDYKSISFIEKPSWVVPQPDPRKMDSKAETQAADLMFEEREKAMKVSAKARRWEESRKKEWHANKKYWKKDLEHKKEVEEQKVIAEVSSKYGL